MGAGMAGQGDTDKTRFASLVLRRSATAPAINPAVGAATRMSSLIFLSCTKVAPRND